MANEVRALEHAVERTGIEVPLVLVNDPEDPPIDPTDAANAINKRIGTATLSILFDVLKQERAWTMVYAERKVAELWGSMAPSMVRIPVEDVSCLQVSDVKRVTPIRDGSWSELPLEAVDLVRERCDLGVRFGFGLLRGAVLRAPRLGVLSFHSADIREYRGLGAPQVWLDGRDTAGVTLQRLNDDIDGGEIIAYRETDISGCSTLWEVYEALHRIKAELLAEGIERLRDPTFDAMVPDSLGPYYPIGRRQQLAFAGRTVLKNLEGRARRWNPP